MSASFSVFPLAASGAAARIDLLFLGLLLLTGTVAIVVLLLLVTFCIRYRAGSPADRSNPPSGDRRLEIAWIVAPLIAFVAVYAWAAYDYTGLYRAPPDAITVFVVAKQWMWKLEHINGRREIDELHVPLDRPVRLLMTSQDVIHSFFAPAFRLKQDVLPGRYTSIWFQPTRLGEFHLFCTEYCGTDHARMGGRIIVMQPTQFAAWLQEGRASAGLAARGFELFRRYGCSGCHASGATVHAPDLTGLIGRGVHLQDGSTLIADENYVRDSILLPKKQIVAGFEPVMPSFAGQIGEEELAAIIQYLRATGHEATDPYEPRAGFDGPQAEEPR